MQIEGGAIIALIGLEVAVLFGSLAMIYHYINNHIVGKIKQIQHKVTSVARDSTHQAEFAGTAARLFALLDSSLAQQHVLLRRVFQGNLDSSTIARSDEEFRSGRRDLNRAMQTLILYSGNRAWRQSALKQLSEAVGDADSLCTLVLLQQYEEDIQRDFVRAIADLKKRLNERRDGVSDLR